MRTLGIVVRAPGEGRSGRTIAKLNGLSPPAARAPMLRRWIKILGRNVAEQ
jgi:hypothetical protein